MQYQLQMQIPEVSFYHNIPKPYGIDISSLLKKINYAFFILLTVSHIELLEPYLLDQVQHCICSFYALSSSYFINISNIIFSNSKQTSLTA